MGKPPEGEPKKEPTPLFPKAGPDGGKPTTDDAIAEVLLDSIGQPRSASFALKVAVIEGVNDEDIEALLEDPMGPRIRRMADVFDFPQPRPGKPKPS